MILHDAEFNLNSVFGSPGDSVVNPLITRCEGESFFTRQAELYESSNSNVCLTLSPGEDKNFLPIVFVTLPYLSIVWLK